MLLSASRFAAEMAKLIFTLLLFGIGCILAWTPPEGSLRHRGCKKSCLQFASFLKKQDFEEPGFVFTADPALLAMTFCIKERLHVSLLPPPHMFIAYPYIF